MTRQKSKIEVQHISGGPGQSNEGPGVKLSSLDLRSQFNALDPKEQEAVINFFNLHNAAIWIYSTLSTPAVEYVNLSIKLSQEKVKEEV